MPLSHPFASGACSYQFQSDSLTKINTYTSWVFQFVVRTANSLEGSTLCISFRYKMWDIIFKGLQASLLLDLLFRKWTLAFVLFSTGLLCHSYHWAGSAYNSQHPFMAVAFCGAACIFVSSDYPLCSCFEFCFHILFCACPLHKFCTVCWKQWSLAPTNHILFTSHRFSY